ncbi:hypothetical protein HDF26_004885 [Pedobacter cryoconitis]|uniref:hypothetical protein n=1 Tax=Pedobacter cryoconitis TaxID=188932 RepID=UPI00161E1BD8|nr:hypothetical protein [Pedobacter cryoconitis]MBB6274411.1 hypothetical protein [Pedobacter cryoconitis]
MNKKLLLSFGILLLFTLHSCKKDRNAGASENKKEIITLSEARAFFETEVLRNSKLSMAIKNSKKKLSTQDLLCDSKINDLLYKNPIWDKAYSKAVDNGTALAIPIHFDVKSYIRTGAECGINFDNLNYLLITKSPEGFYIAEWVTLYPDMDWIKGNRQSYTGRIVVSDWDGNIKSSYGFEKLGKISANNVSRSTQTLTNNSGTFSKITTTESYRSIDGKCYENIREVQDPVGIGVTLYRREVDCEKEIIPSINNPGGTSDPNKPNGGGMSGGGNYPPPNCNSDPNYVMPTGTAPDGKAYLPRCQDPVKEEPIVKPVERDITKEIIVTVEDECILTGVNTAIGAKTTIKDMLNSTFNGNDYTDYQINFSDVTTLKDNVFGTSQAMNKFQFDISLNRNILPGRSKEFIVSTVYHEVLHAYLGTKYIIGPDGKYIMGDEHSEIANNYIALLTGSLKVAFPNISNQEAWALSWGGLEETPFYMTKLSQAERNEIQKINNQHKKSIDPSERKGTYCK